MLRRVDYRIAINLFVFTGLWFVIGAIVLWSPVPGALGIGGGLFAMWVLLFFGVLAVAGSALTLAAINSAFPGAEQPSPRVRTAAQRPVRSAASPSRATPTPATSPPRTRKPARTPLWAPSHTSTPTPENTPLPSMDVPPTARRPQRGDA